MSDNPADSLRRELEAAAMPVVVKLLGEDCTEFEALCWVDLVAAACEPIVSAGLEAARADERERLQQENQELRAALKEANQANERLLMALDSGGV